MFEEIEKINLQLEKRRDYVVKQIEITTMMAINEKESSKNIKEKIEKILKTYEETIKQEIIYQLRRQELQSRIEERSITDPDSF